MEVEEWKTIPEFENYKVSNFGRVYNCRRERVMQISFTNFGHSKISLIPSRPSMSGERFTRSVAQLVAEAYVTAPNETCDQVVVLDGDYSNVSANNLVWRPAWFAWKYARQLKTPQPIYYQNLEVLNLVRDILYVSIIQAGMMEGLLFADIWRSTYTGDALYPDGSIFEIPH